MSSVSASVPGIANSQLDVRGDRPVGNLHKLIARHGFVRRGAATRCGAERRGVGREVCAGARGPPDARRAWRTRAVARSTDRLIHVHP